MKVTPIRDNVMRGSGPSALNAQKTHCVHGHEFTPENTYLDDGGWRQCRTCQRERANRHYAANREKVNAKKRERRVKIVYDERPCEHCDKLFTPERSTGRMCRRLECINSRQRENRNKRLGRE